MIEWHDTTDPFTGTKGRRFDWVDDAGEKRAWHVSEGEALYDLDPNEAAQMLVGWNSLF